MRKTLRRCLYYPNDTFLDNSHRPVQYQWLPRRVLLVRHGESEANVDREVYSNTPDWRIALTERGRDQAFDCGRRLRRLIGDEKVYIYYSPYTRTQQTLEEIRKSLSEGQVQGEREDERLREQEIGNYQPLKDMDATWAARREFNRLYYRFPFGESSADVGDRVSGFFDSLLRERIGLTVPNMNESMLKDATEDVAWDGLGRWQGREHDCGRHLHLPQRGHHQHHPTPEAAAKEVEECSTPYEENEGNHPLAALPPVLPISDLGAAADRGVLPPNALGASGGDDQNVVIIAHGLLLRLFIGRWFRVPMEVFETMLNPPNCAIVVLERDDTIDRLVMTDCSRQLFGSDPLLQMMRFDGHEDAQWYRRRFLGIIDPDRDVSQRTPEDDDENHYSRSYAPKDYKPPPQLVDDPPVKRPVARFSAPKSPAAAASCAATSDGLAGGHATPTVTELSQLPRADPLPGVANRRPPVVAQSVKPIAASSVHGATSDLAGTAVADTVPPTVTQEEKSLLAKWLRNGFW